MIDTIEILKYAQEVTFEGCGYCLIAPEDRDDIASEIERLERELAAAKAREPVAWMLQLAGFRPSFHHGTQRPDDHENVPWVPLIAIPAGGGEVK